MSGGDASEERTADERTADVAANLARVRSRIAAAASAVGRPAADITLIAVTKTRPASDVARLAALGITDVGENRAREAELKHAELADLPLLWHFIGQLQRNKVRSVASYADVVQSVDRTTLLDALGPAAGAAGRVLEVLLQVDLELPLDAGGPQRGGAAPADIPRLADAVAGHPALRLRGVMAVAPRGGDPTAAFERLAAVAARLRADHPAARWVSAGMSGDLEAAVAAGATHVRIGSALLGQRAPLG